MLSLANKQDYVIGYIMGHVNKVAIDKYMLN